jgi:hypothetical protein
VNRPLLDVSSVAALTEEAKERAAKEEVREECPYFQLPQDGLRSLRGFATKDVQGRASELVCWQVSS